MSPYSVVECRAAAMLLAKSLGLAEPTTYRNLGKVQQDAGRSLDGMGDAVAEHVRRE